MGLFARKPKGRHALGAAVTSIPSGPLQAPPAVAAPPAPWEAPAPAAAPPAAPVMPPREEAAPDLMSSISTLIASGEAWVEEPTAPRPVAAAPMALPVPEQTRRVLEAPAPVLAERPAEPVAAAPLLPPLDVLPLLPPPVDVLPSLPPAPVAPPQHAPVEIPALDVPAAAPASARSALESALAELLPAAQAHPRQHALHAPIAPATVAQAPAVAVPAPLPAPAPAPVPPAQAPAPPASVPAPADQAVVPAPAPAVAAAPAPAPSAPSRVQLGFRDGTSATLARDSSQYSALEQLAQSLTRRD